MKWYENYDEASMTAQVNLSLQDDLPEEKHEVPFTYEVCGDCNGRGTRVNPNIDGNGITDEEFARDPEFRRAYFSGVYDQPCPACGGKRVVPKCDDPEVYAAYDEYVQDRLAHEAEIAAERRFGC